MQVSLEINGVPHTLAVDGGTTLLDLLRDNLRLTGMQRVCDGGWCGACTVLLDGLPVNACILLAGSCRGRRIATIESPAPNALRQPRQRTTIEALEFLSHTDLQVVLTALNHAQEYVRPLAGGTDLVPLLERGALEIDGVLDISQIEGLRGISEAPGVGLMIGSLVSLDELAIEPRLHGPFAALAQAAALSGPAPIRNVATLGGNLLQRPCCPYFRSPEICWLKGGTSCPAREGENRLLGIFEDSPCVAVHPSDIATALFVFDAAVHVASAWQSRAWPVDRFFRPPFPQYRDETSLEGSELITAVQLPLPPAGLRSVYLREANADPAEPFALAGVALAAVVEGRRLRDVRLALGAVATVPRRLPAAEAILAAGEITSGRLDEAAAAALDGARPLNQNAYKLPLVRRLIHETAGRLLDAG